MYASQKSKTNLKDHFSTGPELLLFREELPEDKVTRNHFLELQSHRQTYKKAFIDEKLWAILAQTLGKLLKKDFGERSEDDGLVIERILILVRNILQVPRDSTRERCNNDEVRLFHFKIPTLRFLSTVRSQFYFLLHT